MTPAMTCRDGVALLMDYTEGRLSSPRRAAVEVHLAGCPRCRGFAASYRETPRILREATASVLPRSAARRLRRLLRGLVAHRAAVPGGRRH